jgi:hypothetical protein
MPHRTAQPATTAELSEPPVDEDTMRAAARRLLIADAPRPSSDELALLILQLRGHIDLLIPEVDAATLGLPKDDVPRACALACVGEARMRLRLGDGDTDIVRLSVATKLARSVNALCDHLTNLKGAP